MAEAIEPFANISAQDLLEHSFSCHGWVRKKNTSGWNKRIEGNCKFNPITVPTREYLPVIPRGEQEWRSGENTRIDLTKAARVRFPDLASHVS